MAKKKKKEDALEEVTLGIRLGNLPESTVDAMFAGLCWEAERDHGTSVRALIAATFAAARVEAEIMSDDDMSPRDRLSAAKQFKEGFRNACAIVTSEPNIRKRAPVLVDLDEGDPSVPSALARMYGDSK
jgi:hypothetical protein